MASATETPATQISALKSGIGKTGVSLRWHNPEEYAKLTAEQRTELWNWRHNQQDSSEGGSKKKKRSPVTTTDAEISALVEKKVQAKLKQMQKKQDDENEAKESLKGAIAACLQDMVAEGEPVQPKTKKVRINEVTLGATEAAKTVAGPTLQKILKHIHTNKKSS